MKERIKQIWKRVQAIIPSIVFFLFFFSGWVAYIYNRIEQNEQETQILIEQHNAIHDSIKVTHVQYRVPEEFYEYVDKLLNENSVLRDSLMYYSMFYNLVNENHNMEYQFSVEDSSNTRKYKGRLIEESLIPDTFKLKDPPNIEFLKKRLLSRYKVDSSTVLIDTLAD